MYEKAYRWGSGEGDSSHPHGLPDGDYDYVVYGTGTVLKGKVKSEQWKIGYRCKGKRIWLIIINSDHELY